MERFPERLGDTMLFELVDDGNQITTMKML
jgi:hypothetical protein